MSREHERAWHAGFPNFVETPARTIVEALRLRIEGASPEQIRAWQDSIPRLQGEADEVLRTKVEAARFSALLEYTMPMESRRPDCVFLVDGAIVVLELKGKQDATQADIDQVAAYARDLRCYHRDCEGQPVHAVLVPTRAHGYLGARQGVHVCGLDAVDDIVRRLERRGSAIVPAAQFLQEEAYRPLPTLVAAARELFTHGTLRRIRRAEAATRPAVELLSKLTREAAAAGSRKLVLLSGVPGAGKTLVGLQLVHARWLDDLSVERGDGKPAAPAVFLSGNGPLVEVLQYELRGAGGGGKVFVRGVRDYVSRYLGRESIVPPEHVLVFDEAQRAFSREMIASKHGLPVEEAMSQPELFIRFAERIPRWCVVLGLIGGGQEIHKGEEDGIAAWRRAIERSQRSSEWSVHCPPSMTGAFDGWSQVMRHQELSLDQELRFHLTRDVHLLVAKLLDAAPADENRRLAERLEADGFHLRVTRELAVARGYLRDRFGDDPDRRFGIVASSRDKDLTRFRVYNDYQATKRIRYGPWYGAPENDPSKASCRLLRDCVTEFGAQGLELDAALVAWGTDLRLRDGRWDMSKARSYKRDAVPLRDPGQLRLNSYRVLLTRGREGSVIFVPPLEEMDETANYFECSGIRSLDD